MIEASPRRLLVFKTVVDLEGFNAAADRLGIAQPSVGAHVKALERQVGQSLLQRHRGARPQLTEAGKVIYAMAGEIVALSETAARQIAELKAKNTREIVLAAHRDLAVSFLTPYLNRFSRKHTRTKIVTRIGTIDDVLATVQAGTAQMGVLLSTGPLQGLRSEVIAHEPLYLVVAKTHALARRKGITPADLKRQAFVTGLKQSRYVQMTEKVLRSVAITDLNVALELQESSAVREALKHGHYIACLPACTFAADSSDTLVPLDLATPIPPLQIRCVYAANPGSAVQNLLQVMRS